METSGSQDLHDIVQVEVVANHRLRFGFDDGTVGEVDVSGRDWPGVQAPLAHPELFARGGVDPESGTVSWPNGVDLAPEPLVREGDDPPATVRLVATLAAGRRPR